MLQRLIASNGVKVKILISVEKCDSFLLPSSGIVMQWSPFYKKNPLTLKT